MTFELFFVAGLAFGVRWDFRSRHLWFYLGPVCFVFLFPCRVLCSKCSRPAVMLCVHADGWGLGSMRDPLCIVHGFKLGVCPDSIRLAAHGRQQGLALQALYDDNEVPRRNGHYERVRAVLADNQFPYPHDWHVPIPSKWFFRPLPCRSEPEPEPAAPVALLSQYRKDGYLPPAA